MNNLDWQQRMEMLVVRFSHLGISGDLAALSLIEAWALYCLLMRLSGSE